MEIISSWLLAVAGGIAAMGAWVMNRIHKRLDDLEDSHAKHKLHVAENYVPKVEMNDMRNEMRLGLEKIDTTLTRIYDKLDTKVDK